MACSPSAEAAHGTGQGTLWFRICLQQTQVVRACLGTPAKKDREACCSPRSAHKLSKKKKKKKNLSEDCLFWQESNWPGENIRQPFPVCWKQEGTNISNPFQKEIDTVSAFCSYLAAPCIIQSSTPAWDFGGGSEHVCEQFFQHPSVRIQPPLNSLTCIQTKPVSLRSGGESTPLFCSVLFFGGVLVFGSGLRGMPADTMSKTKYPVPEQTHRTYWDSSIQGWVQFQLEPVSL